VRALEYFLSAADVRRVCCVLEKLQRHGLRNFAITGSLALELQLLVRNQSSGTRALNDLDIVIESFTSVPSALANEFLVRHVHPLAPEGKMVLQFVDPKPSLRIDVFRAYGLTLARSQLFHFEAGAIQVVAVEDLVARTASLLIDLERGCVVARKHAQDFERLSRVVSCEGVAAAWQEHRKPTDPASFKEATRQISELVASCGSLLVIPDYSQDVETVCPKCVKNETFPLASASTIKSILGYC